MRASIRLRGWRRLLEPVFAGEVRRGEAGEAQRLKGAARSRTRPRSTHGHDRMRIGELARRVGVSTDTVRFYERSGWLPRASRQANTYRDYDDADIEHLRLLVDLRRLEVPLDEAARIACWCHSGHCADMTAEMPRLISERRTAIAERIAGLVALDRRLAGLEHHVSGSRRSLEVIGADGACCSAALAVVGSAEDLGCACCSSDRA